MPKPKPGNILTKIQKPKPGNIFTHFKGGTYKVMTIARCTETGGDLVVYMDVRTPSKIWARPVESWMKKVTVSGELVDRFCPVMDIVIDQGDNT